MQSHIRRCDRPTKRHNYLSDHAALKLASVMMMQMGHPHRYHRLPQLMLIHRLRQYVQVNARMRALGSKKVPVHVKQLE